MYKFKTIFSLSYKELKEVYLLGMLGSIYYSRLFNLYAVRISKIILILPNEFVTTFWPCSRYGLWS